MNNDPLRDRGVLDALLRLREWRADQARLELARANTELRRAQGAAQDADEARASILDGAARAGHWADPILHAQLLRCLARGASDARLATADLARCSGAQQACSRQLQVRQRECEALQRAAERASAEHRAQLARQAWAHADSAWIASSRRGQTP